MSRLRREERSAGATLPVAGDPLLDDTAAQIGVNRAVAWRALSPRAAPGESCAGAFVTTLRQGCVPQAAPHLPELTDNYRNVWWNLSRWKGHTARGLIGPM